MVTCAFFVLARYRVRKEGSRKTENGAAEVRRFIICARDHHSVTVRPSCLKIGRTDAQTSPVEGLRTPYPSCCGCRPPTATMITVCLLEKLVAHLAHAPNLNASRQTIWFCCCPCRFHHTRCHPNENCCVAM